MMDHLITLVLLTLLQAVLGFDNLLYISLESKRAPKDKQGFVRKAGIGVAMILRIALLFILMSLIDLFQDPWFGFSFEGLAEGSFNLHSLIVLFGGGFILYTATKEIWHMLSLEQHGAEEVKPKSVGEVVFWIVVMNLVFSFDSILSAMALTRNFYVMAAAIVIGGLMMMVLSDQVSKFLQKNRMYEVLGLFVLFVVGVMLVTEGGHLAHIKLADQEIMPMTKTTFYFVISILVIVEVVQGRYQKKLSAMRERA